MNCKLPHISALDNSRQFLIDLEAIDDSNKILDDIAFDSIVKELEQDNIKAYQVSGKPWLRDVTKGGEIAIPNIEVLNKIDQKRKDLGLYEDQLSADLSEDSDIIPPNEQVGYQFRVVNALQSDKVRQPKLDNLQGFYNDLQKQGIPSQQIDLVKDILSDVKGSVTKDDIIKELLLKYSYGVEIETSKYKYPYNASDPDYDSQGNIIHNGDPTSYYSDLTVGPIKNYKENNIIVPGITPSIRAHGQFSTDNTIGWTRTWEYDSIPNTLIIGELQSDLFQKSRDKGNLISADSEDSNFGILELENGQFAVGYSDNTIINKFDTREEAIEEATRLVNIKKDNNQNKFLQLLNKDNQWVTFFTRSIIQDSAKRGYEKVLFPTGNTAAKIEGHTTIEEEERTIKEDIEKIKKGDIETLRNKTISETTSPKVENQHDYQGTTKEGENFVNLDRTKGYSAPRHLHRFTLEDLDNPNFEERYIYFEPTRDIVHEYSYAIRENGKYYKSVGFMEREEITKEEFIELYKVEKEKLDKLINSKLLKNQIEYLENKLKYLNTHGFGALQPIFKFYEETVGNILKKNYKDKVNRITDEYGNQWWELNIDRSRDLTDIMFQFESSQLPIEVTPELKSTLEQFAKKLNPDFKIEVLDDLLKTKGLNGIANLKNFSIQLQRGKESALAEEVSHFLIELMEDSNPLKQTMRDEITRTRLYKMVRNSPDYKQAYGNNVDLLKREAMAKLVSLYLTDKELFKYYSGSDSLVENLVRWIKDFFRWVKGKSSSIGSFIKAAEKIVNLDTEGLTRDRNLLVEQMYSFGEFAQESTVLTTVGNLNTRLYNKVYINISDTVLDSSNYFSGSESEKKSVLMGENPETLKEFFANADFTHLGRELVDKVSTQGITNVEFYTSLPYDEVLVERFDYAFPGAEIHFLNKRQLLEDEDGNLIEVITNTTEDFLNKSKESGEKAVFIDNKPPTRELNIEYRNYRNSRAKVYESFLDRIRRKDSSEQDKLKLDTLIQELKQANKEPLVEKIKQAFNIVKREVRGIQSLERRLESQGLEEDESMSLFRDEGDILLPENKARQGLDLLDKVERYEELLLTYVGTIESVTEFFKRRNASNYEAIKDRLLSGTQENLDIAIQELSFVTKMGNKWKDYVNKLREVIRDTPNTRLLYDLLGDLVTQIDTSKDKSRSLAVQVIGNKLAPALEVYNSNRQADAKEMSERLEEETDEDNKKRMQKSIEFLERQTTAEDIIDILNGEVKDITPLTVWIEPLANTSDPLIASLEKLLIKSQLEVEVGEIAQAQELGELVTKEEKIVSTKEWQDKILYLDKVYVWEGSGEERKRVTKDAWTFLHPFKNEWKKEEKEIEMLQFKDKWVKALQDNSVSEERREELKKEYFKKREELENFLNLNWHREYLPEYYSKYNELTPDENSKELLDEVKMLQQSLFSQIENLALEARTQEGKILRDTNHKIEVLKTELKLLKNEFYPDGTPKTGKELEIAKLLQKKSEIDRRFYDYDYDYARFRGDFHIFMETLNLPEDVKETLRLKLKDNNFTEVYRYARKKNLFSITNWLDDNAVTRYHPDWYEQRKNISEQISSISEQIIDITGAPYKVRLNEIWQELFGLTSYLRDEDGIFDGIMASTTVQSKVQELDTEIERIRELTREHNKDIKTPILKELREQLSDLIKELDDIQSKKVTDSYKDHFNELIRESGFADIHNKDTKTIWIEGINILEFINYESFQKTLKENPEHPFSVWFNNNHFRKTYFENGDAYKAWTPTYIWFKIEPSDKKYVLLSPSFKYSKRIVKKEWETKKTELTYNSALDEWNPKSEEFFNPDYNKLYLSSDPKDKASLRILKALTDYHLTTQASTSVREGQIGYTLPYIKKQMYEPGYLKSLKRDFFDTSNRFEEGAGNFDDQVKKTNWLQKNKTKILNFWNNQEQEEDTQEESQKIMRVAVPFTHYLEPENTSKDALMSVIRYSASTRKADKMMKSLPLINLIEDSILNSPRMKKGKPANPNSHRIAALKFAKENMIYGINQRYEVGKPVENVMRTIRKINTIGSLGFNIGNVLKNNLQGRIQNVIGGTFGDWSSNKSMYKASMNPKTNYAWYVSQAEKPLAQRDRDYHIISWLNPSMDTNIFDNLIQGSTKRNLGDKNIMMFNEVMEFSISVNLMYARLYHVKVVNEKGEQKLLYDILDTSSGKMTVLPGWKDKKTGRAIDMDYMMETKLAYRTVAEYVQGRVSQKTLLSSTTIGQSVLYFKNWLIPMLRRRFDSKRANYMLGEDLEGYWRVFGRMSLLMLRDLLKTAKVNWHTYTPQEQRDYAIALKEIAFMITSLIVLSLVFGFEADDPDKFKKLKKNSFAENYALLMMIQAKNETEALSPFPFANVEKSLVPPVLTEGVKWFKNPTIGLSIIDNTWKTTNAAFDLLFGRESAYYDRNMPQFDIEKGDTKLWRQFAKITQFDDILLNDDPEQKIRSVINNMKR